MSSWPQVVRGEPEYIDQVPRLLAYKEAHPSVEVIYFGPHWQAIIREDDGMTIVTRMSLKGLMDKLEALLDEASVRAAPGR